MQIPQYTRKDLQILAITMPVVVTIINLLLFGTRFFTEGKIMLGSGLFVLLVMTAVWFLFTWIAVTIRSRFPAHEQQVKRLAITVLFIATIQAVVMTLFFQGYNQFNLFGYELNAPRYYWTLVIGFILNIIITIVHEGFDRFERWKATLTETEQLKTAYTQSQLMGLRSQVNPHFLFNSLNSLSSLIAEDTSKAEKFLNELTKVYRYLLRSADDKLVTLETEVGFIQSYFYLLKSRYGDKVNLQVNLDERALNKYVSPFLLQTIFEYSFNNSSLQKEKPLNFLIAQDDNCRLVVKNNLQEKQGGAGISAEGLKSLVEKYKLICFDEPIVIEKTDSFFKVQVPLLNETQNKR
jgi:sensor histidine kinase YesM